MTEIIPSLAAIASRYDALFCDLWGCVHNGVTAFPAAVAALQQFRAGGGVVVLVTNAPRPSAAVIRSFPKLGVPDDAWDFVVSSGDASRAAVLSGAVGRKVWHCGPDKDESFFTETSDGLDPSGIERVPFDEAEGIVCTGLFDEENDDPEDYRDLLIQARDRGLKLACTNPDIVVDMGDKRIFCAGAIAALYTEIGGKSEYYGKPYPPIYDLARARAASRRKISDDHILCIGDGIHTDVKGGQLEGLDTLFITGGLSATEFGPDPRQPDPALIERRLAAEGLTATYAIPYLG